MFVKNLNFGQKFKTFVKKSKFWSKTENVCQKPKFWSKIALLKNIFSAKLDFYQIILMSDRHPIKMHYIVV